MIDDSDLVKFLRKQPEVVEELISDFLLYQRYKRPLKATSINLSKSAIVHFFKRNRIRLDKVENVI